MSCVVCRVWEGSSQERQDPSVDSNKLQTTNHKRNRAFTLIEILIVVGIIGLLTAIAVIGFRVVGGATKSKVTAVALENCKGLLASYKETSDAKNLIDIGAGSTMYKITNGSGPLAVPPPSLFRWGADDSNSADITTAFAIAPGMTYAGTAVATLDIKAVNERYLRDETGRVIKRLSAVPFNRKAIDAMSADRLSKVRVPTDAAQVLPTAMGGTPEYATTVAVFEGVNVLDGNGQPIYFIPGGGLRGVNVGYIGKGYKSDPANYDRANQHIRAPDHAPFWASPGPDGDLTTGDDNAYSFGGN